MDIRPMACCGLRELHGLSYGRTADENMRDFKRMVGPGGGSGTGFRYVVFTQADNPNKYGEDFANLIRAHDMGDVIETTGTHKNPNTHHVLKAWMWTVNHAAVKRYGAPPKAAPQSRRRKVVDG